MKLDFFNKKVLLEHVGPGLDGLTSRRAGVEFLEEHLGLVRILYEVRISLKFHFLKINGKYTYTISSFNRSGENETVSEARNQRQLHSANMESLIPIKEGQASKFST